MCYVFQPIFSARTGKVMGPTKPRCVFDMGPRSPATIMKLARAHCARSSVLTFFKSLENLRPPAQ